MNELDKNIGVTPCKYCGGFSDRWFVGGYACKQCFDLLHTFTGSLEEKEDQMELSQK